DPGSNSFYGIQMETTPGIEWRAAAWSEDRLIPHDLLVPLLRDYYGYSGPELYIGPECSNVILGESYPETCDLVNDDSTLPATGESLSSEKGYGHMLLLAHQLTVKSALYFICLLLPIWVCIRPIEAQSNSELGDTVVAGLSWSSDGSRIAIGY